MTFTGKEFKMFKITGILAEKFHPQGHVLRMQQSITMPLNTEAGVVRFLQEQRPFTQLVVTEIETKVDKTQYFLDKVKEEDERSAR